MEQGSPRNRIRALVNGEQCGSPLLMPIVFSLGSRLENVSLREFLLNPTKIANALRQIRATLKVDGICCYFDPLLEIEALGGKVEWTGESAQLVTAGFSATAARDSVEDILRNGRVPVAIEVLKRAKLMLRDEPALMIRVTGPLTLASQLARCEGGERPDFDLVERCAESASTLVKAYLDSGADVVFLVENSLPLRSREFCDRWAGLLDPIINVARFYERLPVLVLNDSDADSETLRLIAEQNWECALCSSVVLRRMLPTEAWTSSSPLPGVAIDAGALMQSFDSKEPARVHEQWQQSKASFLTTTEDISSAGDLKQLTAGLQQLRGALAAAS